MKILVAVLGIVSSISWGFPSAEDVNQELRQGFSPVNLSELAKRAQAAEAKREWRKKRFFSDHSVSSAWETEDSARVFVDTFQYSTLEAIEAAGLRSAALAESPWSDHYWPHYLGNLGYRYADENFPESLDWKKNSDYLTETMGKLAVDKLSPAEKYDLLLGTPDFTLTRAGLAEGKSYYDRFQKVETWMGLCHGWAPASYMVSRPTRKIEVLAADGTTRVSFYPSDIKALTTLLWANSRYPTRFIGGRCEEKKPEADEAGRPKDPNCLDNNPGTWHLSVVNQIGHSKRSFVMDMTYSYEVWNQPVLAYSYIYFNPRTKKAVKTLEEGRVELAGFDTDRFSKSRSRDATAVVGVAMDVTYVSESVPGHHATDSESRDQTVTLRYLYDLEINAQGEIIGGEWWKNDHPDFLWSPEKGARVTTAADEFLRRIGRDQWNSASEAVPVEWRKNAGANAARNLPLALVVEELVRASRQ